MSIASLKVKLKDSPENVEFSETIEVIENNYNFTPTAFVNGTVNNEREQNSGSCKLFAFAQLEGLSKSETLACFGQYYRDVLSSPEGDDHQNIRNFMVSGFDGLTFSGIVLQKK